MRVLTIDDHGMFRYGLRLMLEQQFQDIQVLEAGSILEGLEAAEAGQPIDLVLVDLMLGSEDGVVAIRELRRRVPETPIAALTASEDAADVERVRQAGAMGFIRKSFGPDILKNVIELILSGERFYPVAESSPRNSPERTDSEHGPVRSPAPGSPGAARLTPRQLQILRRLVDGLSNKEIARELDIIEGTVKAHIRSMMGRLGVKNRTQLAMTAARLGMLDIGSNPLAGNPSDHH